MHQLSLFCPECGSLFVWWKTAGEHICENPKCCSLRPLTETEREAAKENFRKRMEETHRFRPTNKKEHHAK